MCPQGPSSMCADLPAWDPITQLTTPLDLMLCTKAAQRGPSPANPPPTPLQPLQQALQTNKTFTINHTHILPQSFTDNLRLEKTQELTILSFGLLTNSQIWAC